MWNLLLIPPLLILAYSDLKSRMVTIGALLLFGLTSFFVAIIQNSINIVIINITFNLITASILYFVLKIYSILKKKALSKMIGAGDGVFIALSSPLFSPMIFILYLTMSFLATLVFWLFYRFLFRDIKEEIPLVTGMASGLIIFSIIYFML